METQTFLGRNGSPVTIARSDVDNQLCREFEGEALQRGHSKYDEARKIWNAMIDRHPSLIARCHSRADAQRCVRFARAQGLAVTVRGGGHNVGGRAIANDTLMIDMSQQREVRVDPERRMADAAPGALLRDVDQATLPHSLVLPTGIVSETGLAGLTLGGGFGWLSRRFGLTCDHLIEAEVVTGRGDVILANERENTDLLWALRGGGGGCAVVTNFRFRLRTFDPSVTAGLLARDSQQTEDAFHRFRVCTTAASEDMTCMLKLCAAPPAPFLPSQLHGKPVGLTLVCHSGERAKAADALSELRRGPGVAADLIQTRQFGEFQSMFDAGEPKGRRDYWKSEYVTELDDHMGAMLLDAIRKLPSPHANVKVFQLGGAVPRVSPADSAAGHRDARYIIVVASAWENPDDDARNIDWVREIWKKVHARSGRGGYINFLTADADAEERASASSGVNLDRLVEVRKRYDPDGIFVGLT